MGKEKMITIPLEEYVELLIIKGRFMQKEETYIPIGTPIKWPTTPWSPSYPYTYSIHTNTGEI